MSDKCQDCERRKAAEKAVRPFDQKRRCPECRTHYGTLWKRVCRGDIRMLVKEGIPGTWFRKPVPPVTRGCELDGAPRHFHVDCENCGTHWTMLTAEEHREAVGEEPDDVYAGPPKKPPPGPMPG